MESIHRGPIYRTSIYIYIYRAPIYIALSIYRGPIYSALYIEPYI